MVDVLLDEDGQHGSFYSGSGMPFSLYCVVYPISVYLLLLVEPYLVLSFTDNRYSEHSVFYYWKSILLCGAIKAVQVYLWISALSSCGPFIYVLFEQSPKLIFVIFGLLSNSYSSNREALVIV